MTSLLTKLPRVGFRPAGGLSSRLGCHVLGHRGHNAVVRPWLTRQQVRFSSSDTDTLEYDDPTHYATLDVEISASTAEIREAWAEKCKKLHSDHTRTKSPEATEQLVKVQAAGDILRFPERKAVYDARHGFNKPARPIMTAKQPREAGTRSGGIDSRFWRMQVVKLREQQQRKEAGDRMAARAAAEAQAAEAKKRDEALKAQELASRAAARGKAQAEAQKQAEKKKAEKKQADQEAAARGRVAAQARKAELAKQRERGACLVVLRDVPAAATAWDLSKSLLSIQPGRILDMGCERGIAWVEFSAAEQAKSLHNIITETGWFTIGDTRILNAEIRQGIVPVPQGPDLITRCLRIAMPAEFWKFLVPGENLNRLMARKLRERGFRMPIVNFYWGETYDGMWILRNHFSVAQAQSAKAAIEKYYPQLGVTYAEDPCGGLPQTARENTPEASESNNEQDSLKGPGSDKREPEADNWLAPRPFEAAVMAVFCAIAVWMDMGKDKSSDDKKQ